MAKYRGVIYSKTVIVEDEARTFHWAMSDAIEGLEGSGQAYGWSESIVAENEDLSLVAFTPLTKGYQEEELRENEEG